MFSPDRPDWRTDGADWPNRATSRFVSAGGLDWHVQIMGEGPDLLVLHGTGAATHSFRDLLPGLARQYRVILPDLPGHGFTGMPGSHGLSLPGMATALGALLAALKANPVAGIGHSAGAAILAAMQLAGKARFSAIISINGAFLPIRHAGLFAPLARLLFLNPLAPRLFAYRGRSASAVDRLIRGTGSVIDARGIELYRRLMARAGHIEGALGMMANWDLETLGRDLPRLAIPLILIASDGDKAVPPSATKILAASVRVARPHRLPAGGHLVHEERPEEIVALLLDLLAGLTAPPSVDQPADLSSDLGLSDAKT